MANYTDDLEATKRLFLHRFHMLVDDFTAAGAEAEHHQALAAAATARQDEVRMAYQQLANTASMLGFDLNELIEAQQPPAADAAAAPEPPVKRLDISQPTPRPTVREFILQEAEKASPEAVRASSLRDRFLEVHGVPVHEKTFGMTLYRLSREKPPRMRREGRQDWFFVPAPAADPAAGLV